MPVKPRKPRARLIDLARLVSVSPATISNAYHHPERLSAALRAKILENADKLGYHPDPTARGLRMQTTGTIGVVYADALSWAFIDPPFSMFLQGVAEVTQDAHLRLLLAGATYTDNDVEPVRNVAVDGFVFYAPMMHDPRVAYVGQRELPAVLVDGEPGSGFPSVGIEDERGAFMLADHLFRLGHRKLGIISMPLRNPSRAFKIPSLAIHMGVRVIAPTDFEYGPGRTARPFACRTVAQSTPTKASLYRSRC